MINIKKKCIAIFSDGEPNVNRARNSICKEMRLFSIRCLIHYMNLLVKVFLTVIREKKSLVCFFFQIK